MLSLVVFTLTAVANFGSNPGALQMYEYVPAGLPANRPLVVVMHGCTQTASSMESAGWNKLADQYQFAVLYPQQQSANNPVECFNWAGEYGDPANLVRGQGENESIIQMVDAMKTNHNIDTTKVYIAGFSAGAAFVPVMLATWPDRFAAGAIMEGVAYRCATSVSGASTCMSPGTTHTPQEWGDLVRAAYTYTGARPRVQIWAGTSDTTVVPANATELVKQWTNVFGTDQTADENETIGSNVATRAAYKVNGNVVVEAYSVQGMAHAVAVGAEGSTACPGTTGSYFDGRAICSTIRAAKFFGLVPGSGGGGGGSGGGNVTTPTVSIVSPANGDKVSGELTVVVAAGDDTGVKQVALQIDGHDVGSPDTDAPYQFDWNATAAGTGPHTLVATATDVDGNTAMATETVMMVAGGGGGGGGANGDDGGPNDLPACSLDAGRHGMGGGTWAPILFALGGIFVRRRRR